MSYKDRLVIYSTEAKISLTLGVQAYGAVVELTPAGYAAM